MSARTALLLVLTLISSIPLITACENAGTGSNLTNQIDVPDTYRFESRFQDSTSSVAYPRAVVTNLLVQDLNIFLDSLGSSAYQGGAIAEQELLNFYQYQDEYDLSTLTGGKEFTPKETDYSDITRGVDLSTFISDDPIIGAGAFDAKTAHQLLLSWFTYIAQESQDPAKLGTPAVYTSDTNQDLSELIHKILLGSVVYHQTMGKYLSLVNAQDNRDPSGNSSFTEREHYWDLAFGYFGGARNLSAYDDSALAGIDGNYYQDSNSDNLIDFESEYNFTFARLSGQRDAEATAVDFTSDIFQAFLEGRTNITNGASGTRISGSINDIAEAWEKVIAASVIHHINQLQRDILAQTIDQNELNKSWSAMRGYSIALQYSPFKRISNNEIRELANLLKDEPPVNSAFSSYLDNLETAKVKLKNIYDFSTDNMDQW